MASFTYSQTSAMHRRCLSRGRPRCVRPGVPLLREDGYRFAASGELHLDFHGAGSSVRLKFSQAFHGPLGFLADQVAGSRCEALTGRAADTRLHFRTFGLRNVVMNFRTGRSVAGEHDDGNAKISCQHDARADFADGLTIYPDILNAQRTVGVAQNAVPRARHGMLADKMTAL